MKRRNFLIGTSAMALACAASPLAFAQSTEQELLEPGALPDKTFGADDAPVTIIEYASLTCPHCRTFHIDVWPGLKEKYVDTGKVRFIMREFPFDPRSTAGFMLARCAGDEKWYPTLDLLYRTQETWARVSDGTGAMKSVMGMTGMDEAAFEACLQNEELMQQVQAVAEVGRGFGVDSTPTFFVNGKMYKGALSVAQFSDTIDPLLAASGQ
jgi:protein-disulfide isomerase